MALWFLAFKNLFRNPRRSLVTGLAIAIGYAGLNIFNGYSHRVERALAVGSIYTNHAGHISIQKKGWFEKGLAKPKSYSLKPSEKSAIEDFLKPFDQDILLRVPLLIGIGLISNGCRSLPFFFKGLDRHDRSAILKAPEFLQWTTFINKKFPGSDYTSFSDDDSPIMITENLSNLLNKPAIYLSAKSLPPSQIIDCQKETKKKLIAADPSVQLLVKSWDGGFSALNANVVGHYTVGFALLDDVSMEGPLSLAQKLYDTDSISKLLLFLKDSRTLSTWKKTISSSFHQLFPNMEMVFYDDVRVSPFYAGTTSFLKSLTFLFVLISGLSITLTIINSLTISILERSKEIGTFRALGYTPNDIAWLFGREMILLTGVSLLVGIILAYAISALINSAGITYEPPGASQSIKLEVVQDASFQAITFVCLGALVILVSYWLTKRRVNQSTASLLIHNL